jgi:ribonuclease VapC
LLEAGIVLQLRYGDDGARALDLLLHELDITIAQVSPKQANIARRAYKQFGKGLHAAGLNYGDCFAYALAKDEAVPLLFKGEGFGKTDVQVMVY